MKKKIVTLILIVFAILLTIIIFINRREIRDYLYYEIIMPKETIMIEKQENIKVTYTYNWHEESFDIDITDKELINMIVDNISNKKLNNYSGQIGLAIMGEYTVSLENGISFKFDGYEGEGYVMMINNDKQFLTIINPEILKRIVEIVDVKLTENIEIFKTDRITITNKNNQNIDIERKTAIEYILNQCKNIYTKEMNCEITMVDPDYRINFNNGVEIFKFDKTDKGFLIKDDIVFEAYGLESLDTILEYGFEKSYEKEQMFNTDKIIIKNQNKTVEITDKNIIEKITTPIIYSNMQERDWLVNYDITEEYNNGIKIKINDYEFLIPGKIGTVTIGNRYIISPDKTIKLCFPLQDLEKYANELLEN